MNQPMWTLRVRRSLYIVGLALLWWLLFAPLQPLFAHGADRVLQLAAVVGNNLHLTVWSAPGILRTGEIHIVTAIHNGDDIPRTDVLVQVQLDPLDTDGAHMTALAYPIVDTAVSAKRLARREAPAILHEAAFVVTEPGRYQVQINVMDSAGTSGVATFPMTVVTVPIWFKGLLYLQGVLAVGVGLLLVRRGQQLWFGRPAQPQPVESGQFRAIHTQNDAD